MEIAALLVAVLAMGAAVASALYARGANARADVANERATEALDLQRRIDERAREFVDVDWKLEVDRDWSGGRFTGVAFRNIGLTPAHDVTFVIDLPEFATEVFKSDAVNPGYAAGFISDATGWWMEKNRPSVPEHPPFRVHWSSPLGNVDDRGYEGKGIFEIG